MRRFLPVVAALFVLALPAAASAATQVVWAGGPPGYQHQLQKLGVESNDYFPHSLAIHAGDTVSWRGMSINFHTVDLPPKGRGDLPLLLPSNTVSGVNDAAGNPFWFNGKVPNIVFNSALFAPGGGNKYNGTARVHSALPIKPGSFTVTFTKPGTYVYFCDVHYNMRGIIVVRAKSASVPSTAQVRAEIAKQTARDRALAATLAHPKVAPNTVSLGASTKDNVERLAMLPGTLRVKRGTTVVFTMSRLTSEVHTATFGPKAYLKPIVNSFLTGNPFDPRGVYPSSPPGSPLVITPTAHGNGFLNVGVLDRDNGTKGIPASGRVRFTRAGVYHYQCVIHPFMKGTVIVR